MSIIITGGTKGIGLAIAEHLAAPGVDLVLVYLSDQAAAETAVERLKPSGARVSLVQADVGRVDHMSRITDAAPNNGPVHIIHSAAMIYPTNLLDADLAKFKNAMNVNGLSLLYLVQSALPILGRGSSIVFISSAGARVGQKNYGAIGVGKALAESLIRYLVPELAPRGIRINAVAPGLVQTSSVANMVGGDAVANRLFESMAKAIPAGRITEDRDYTGVVEFLLSPASEFVQGQTIHANGGIYVP